MGNVTITRENEKTVIHLSGRIDSSNAPQVEEEMMKAENGVPVMIISKISSIFPVPVSV